MGFSAHTPLATPARPSKLAAEREPNLSPPPAHDALRISELTYAKDRPKGKDYSQLFGKPGSVLFGIGTRDGGARGQLGGLDGTTWVPPNLGTPVGVEKRREGEMDVAGMGYFVFPPGGSPGSASRANSSAGPASSSTPQKPSPFTQQSPVQSNHPASPSQALNIDSDLDSWDDHLASLHRARLAREALEAQKGEEYWVSCGGVLRDAQGRRDLERTRRVREELKLREREKGLLEMWEEYEKRWGEMVRKVRGAKGKGKQRETTGGDGDGMEGVREEVGCVTFHDIPWPVHIAFSPPPYSPIPSISSLSFKSSPSTPSPYPPPPDLILGQLTLDNIRTFLLDPLTVRGSKITNRERIRSSMLRWHPDKMGGVVEKVKGEDEREVVVRCVGEVVRALQGLMAEVGRERNGGSGA